MVDPNPARTAQANALTERLLAKHGIPNMRCGIVPKYPRACFHPDGRRLTAAELARIFGDPEWKDAALQLELPTIIKSTAEVDG